MILQPPGSPPPAPPPPAPPPPAPPPPAPPPPAYIYIGVILHAVFFIKIVTKNT